MEEVMLKHKSIVEAAVVGKKDALKGEIPIGFIVLKHGVTVSQTVLEKELVGLVRRDIGNVISCFIFRLGGFVQKCDNYR
jgi:propionyl-CoA synthetase